MKKYKYGLFYLSVLSGFTILMYYTIRFGRKLESGRNILIKNSGKGQLSEFKDSLISNLENPLAILLAQIVTIIIAARLFGWVFKKIGQPAVIGEIIAGIVLGPSLIGMYFPEFSAALFPASSLQNLKLLSQIGLILFMFVVGMELDLKVLKNKAHEAVIVSHASIIIPFALGMSLSYFIYIVYAPTDVPFSSFALFMGIAMSITAFPVLARIVQDRGINKTILGAVVITCAAVDDITAWCILAALIAIVKAGSFVSSLYTILLAVVYVFLMLKVVRPFFRRIGDLHTSRENLSKPIVAIFFITLLISSYATESIGIHALFGAFMAGVIMPENMKFRNVFIEKVEDVALVLFLPIFFVFTGLRTEIGLINDPFMWKITGFIILVAIAGKFIGSALAARFVGQSWKDSLTIGALMNTRGLMELVVLNIGYDLGVLSPEIFAMMVIMALVTTFMTGPALDLINRVFKTKSEKADSVVAESISYKILFSFGRPESGKTLLRLANSLTKKISESTELTALHLFPTNKLNKYNVEEYEKESFAPVIKESEKLNRKITSIYKASNDFEAEISDIANNGKYDLLLIGLGQSIYEGSLLGKIIGFVSGIFNPGKIFKKVAGKKNRFDDSPFDERIREILSKTRVPVGIFIDGKLAKIDRVFIPILNKNDGFLFSYAKQFIENIDAQVLVYYSSSRVKNSNKLKDQFGNSDEKLRKNITLTEDDSLEKNALVRQDLIIISLDSWRYLVQNQSIWLESAASILILANKVNPSGKPEFDA
jgi:Kef-type K+ transport system membrane component KefB